MRQRKPAGQATDKCSKCGGPLEPSRIGKQRYCLACHAEYMRQNRPKHSELSEDQRKAANARAFLHVYVKRGLIKKGPCEVCGAVEVEARHEDYSKPLAVRWLCRDHHIKFHNETKNNNHQ